MEQFIDNVIALNPLWIYFAAAGIAYIENIFPPLPSDVIVVAAGYLSAIGRVDFALVLIASTLGSTAGFMTMYKIGAWFGVKVLEKKKFKFIKLDKIHKVEDWFNKYGYMVVVANRFLSGTRAVISFFTGMSRLSFWKTTLLASLSSLVWNAILILAGREVGANWRSIVAYLDTYGKVVTIVSLGIILILLVHGYLKKRNQQKA